MIKSYDPNRERFLADLSTMQLEMEKTQRQVSSGVRVGRASDSPYDVVDLLHLHSDLERNDQLTKNLNQVKAEVDAGERALQLAVSVLQSARVDASNAAGSTGIEKRAGLVEEVTGLLQEMVSLSRTSVGSRYIFSADSDQSPVFQFEPDTAAGFKQLQTPGATRLIEDGDGGSFVPGRTAQEVFDARDANGDPLAGNAFAALNALRTALANNDDAAIGASLATLRVASDYMNEQLAAYGRLQNRVNGALDRASKRDVQLQQQMSAERDTDLAAALTKLTQLQTYQQAALSSEAQLPRTSLFDYLK